MATEGKAKKKWIPLESNPDVLNDFTEQLGLDTSRYSFCDVFGLDEELLAMVPQPVIGVLLCYPVTDESDASQKAEDARLAAEQQAISKELYYMKQTVSNACGTIAVLHAAFNNTQLLQPAEGTFLQLFHSATAGMTPEERGTYLEDPPEGAPNIEAAHQAAAITGDTAAPSLDEVIDLHFVAFVCCDGALYELDGRRAAPVNHGPSSPDTLLPDSVVVIRKFIERTSSLNFNLIALTAAQPT